MLPDPFPEFIGLEFIPPLLMLPEPMLPLLPSADPIMNECPCWAACRLCWFRLSTAEFCEVSVRLERDERIACCDQWCVLPACMLLCELPVLE